ncbi:MAG: hypothetical protein JRH20_08605 [Deltaproteobacteria bacterium]|nr:hypothetical protein [Deltaproteobacteria bacterium]
MLRKSIVLFFVVPALIGLGVTACAPAQVRVFSAKPAVPHRILGMVSGQGPNEASAIHDCVAQAHKVEANGIVVVSKRMLGKLFVIRAQAIHYSGQLPPENAPPQ